MVLRVCYMDTQWRIKGTETEAGKGAEAETGDPTLLLSQTEALKLKPKSILMKVPLLS